MMQILSTDILTAGMRLDLDFTFLVILVLFVFLFKTLKSMVFIPFLADMDLREEETERRKSRADELRAKADELNAQHQEAMAAAKEEAQEIRRVLRVEGLNEKESTVDTATQKATSHYNAVSTQLEGQFESAREQALSQVEEFGRLIATKVLGRNV
jgi:F0F1-type ATP synthase membrane subunit b/b'